jgi:hypothetical protein
MAGYGIGRQPRKNFRQALTFIRSQRSLISISARWAFYSINAPKQNNCMKQLSLLTLCCLLSVFAGAATLSGTVTVGAPTIAPIVGQKVYVIDSFNTYRDSAVTNSLGQYSFTLPGSFTNPTYLFVSSPACGSMNTQFAMYTGSNVTTNFTLCNTFPILRGTVSLGSTTNIGLATVYLIRKQYDPSIMDTTLTAIDSIITATSGGAFAKAYASIPTGTLLMKAALQSTHPSYSSFLPTYDTNATTWSSARVLSGLHFMFSTTINMTAGVNPGGPGFIGGSVLVGANKSTGVGDPLSSRILLLTNNAGQPVAYTYSNASGQFQFPNLAYGTYKLSGDAWGKTNPPLTITISASNPSVPDVVFEENNKTFKGHIGSLNVSGPALSGLSVYPNPVTDYLQLKGLSSIGGAKTIVLSDVTGAVISRQTVEQNGNAGISTAALPAGTYLLQVLTTEGNATYKIVK